MQRRPRLQGWKYKGVNVVGDGGEARWASRTGIITSAEDLAALAFELGRLIPCGGIVALTGPLGVGKTTFAQGFLAGLGVREPVSSPTFTLMHRYQGRCPACHVDLYRLEPGLDPGGFLPELEEALDGVTVLIIEWADRLVDWLPADHLSVELSYLPEAAAGRRVVLRAGGPRHGRLLAALQAPPSGG